MTRLLSADQYGTYALAIASIGLISSIFFQWIAVSVSRFYSVYSEKRDLLFIAAQQLFVRSTLLLLILASMLYFLAEAISISPKIFLMISICAVAMGWHNLSVQVANASGDPLRYGLLTISRASIALLCATVLCNLGLGETGAIVGLVVGCIISVAIFGFRGRIIGLGSTILRKEMVAYGLPLSLTYLSTMVLDVSDRFMIGLWMGPSSVGGYAASYDLTQQTIGVLFNVFFLAGYPKIVAAWESGGTVAVRKTILQLKNILLIVSPLVAGFFIGFTDEITKVFFGEEIVNEARQVMPWVAVAIVIACIKSYYLDISFLLEKKTNRQFQVTAIMAVVNVIGNLILIPMSGLVGAAQSTVAAFSVGAVLSWWYGRRLNIYQVKKVDVLNMLFIFFIFFLTIKLVPVSYEDDSFEFALRLLSGLGSFMIVAILVNHSETRSWLIRKFCAIIKRGVQ